MDFFLGLLAGVVFFIAVSMAYKNGYRAGSQKAPIQKPDEEANRRVAKMQKDFQNLFNYDMNTALKRKKVNHDYDEE
ncbi:hypothetical protein LRR81_08720 [Metabacillus sp. GX 13764]|uniref:hypothetical protein n=1 Tax=Metabacillus kandeliae TaxID=2900151 RepID=UPI001E5DCDF6|nr:hypothetical protein [Metabacillus kandeliae]MCD7034316.1 hypothetical protein [Metabacillus kandeliae]